VGLARGVDVEAHELAAVVQPVEEGAARAVGMVDADEAGAGRPDC
jgi:hypothetical protein